MQYLNQHLKAAEAKERERERGAVKEDCQNGRQEKRDRERRRNGKERGERELFAVFQLDLRFSVSSSVRANLFLCSSAVMVTLSRIL